ncbi:MAG: DUF2807 domain-containing protein [Bacteroides sp.]|nr:DUF2807 domain-containing protein [Bacteroides sp.]
MKQISSTAILTAIFCMVFSVNAMAQQKRVTASKNYITEKRTVGSFNAIQVTGSPDVQYTQTSGSPSLEVYGSDNILEVLETKVEGNTLKIGFKKNTSIQKTGPLKIKVSGPALEKVSITGSGDVTFVNGMNSNGSLSLSVTGSGDIEGKGVSVNELKISVTGSGDIKIRDIQSNSVSATVTGSGDIDLSGNASEAIYRVSGSGDITASNLVTRRVDAQISGSGDIKCHATEFLKGRVSGSGDIGYKGNPEIDFPKKGLYKL